MIKRLSRLCAAFFLSAILVAPAFAQITDRLNGVSTSLAIKAPVKAISSSALVLYGEKTVNGVAVVAGDRVLVKDQADTKTNGIYVVAASNWSRAADFDDNRDVAQGTLVIAYNNIANGVLYQVTTANPVVIGTSAITFTLRDDPTVQYPQTQTEIDSGVTPTNYTYVEGHVYRYGTNTTPGTTNMATAINTAINVESHHANGGEVHIPAGILRITSTINAAANVALVGEGGQSSRILADGCDGITVSFTTYSAKTVFRDFELLGTNSSTHYGIKNPGTLLNTDQTFGLVITRLTIRSFNVAISLRSAWYFTIQDNRIEDNERAIELIGQDIAGHISSNKIVHGSGGGGAGSVIGIDLEAFNYTTVGGQLPPEGIQIHNNIVYGYSTAIRALLANFVNITYNDLYGSTLGIDITTVNLGLNISGNYLDMNTASVVAAIYLRAGLAASSAQTTIRDNAATANTTTTAVGIKVNDSSNGGQAHILIENNALSGFNTNDILVDHAGFTRIIGNKCQSSAPTNSISVPAVSSGFVEIRGNNCAKVINYAAADAAAGGIIVGANIVSGSTLLGAAGVWTSPTFAAGTYTASGSMTWTVAAGDVSTYEYTIVQNTMTVNFSLNTTTVGGTPSTTLKIAIPAGKTAAKQAYNAIGYMNDNGTIRNGIISVAAAGTTINIDRQDAANFTAATDTSYFKGSITFEIQ